MTDDPGSLRQKRITDLVASQQRLLRKRPNPPRGVSFVSGTVSWEEPAELRNVSHYNIYADNESNLVQRVAQGQRSTVLTATRVFVSAFDRRSNLESPRIGAKHVGSPPGGGGGGPETEYVVPYAGSLTIDCANGTNQFVTLPSPSSTVFSAPLNSVSTTLRLFIVQGAGGQGFCSFNAAWKMPANFWIAPTTNTYTCLQIRFDSTGRAFHTAYPITGEA